MSKHLKSAEGASARRSSRLLGTLTLAAAIVLVAAPRTWCQTPPIHQQSALAAGSAGELDLQQQRAAVIRWIDEELAANVLYRPDEITALRSYVEALAPSSFDAFARQIGPLQDLMRTPEWQTANKFFSHYRTLEPVLNAEQRRMLAAGASRLSPHDVVQLMRALIEQRDRLVVEHEAFRYQSQVQLASRFQLIADQDRMRRYALEQAASRNNRNFFPSHQAVAVKRPTPYRVPPPLITSRQMAQWMVFRGLFRW